jgi:hypothetical protein
MSAEQSVFIRFVNSKHRVVREKVLSMVVNAHGGLVRIKSRVRKGQKLTVFNTRKSQKAASRVVWTRATKDKQTLVAFEFDRPTPSIWPVIGWPASWNSAREQRGSRTVASPSLEQIRGDNIRRT